MSQPQADAPAMPSDTADELDRQGATFVSESIPRRPRQPSATVSDGEARWAEIDRELAGRIARRRVLVVGPDPYGDHAAYVARGAMGVTVCAHPDGLEPNGDRPFEIVHCDDLLHRVPEPVTLLRTLRRAIADGGLLLIGSMMIDDPERSEYLRFIPDWQAFALPGSTRCHGGHAGSFLPGRLAFRWMVATAGFEVEAAFGEREASDGPVPLVTGYLRATAR
jgi:SAM-dependent methyltransferase